MHHKKTDSKGRLPLGLQFANMVFIVNEKNPNEIIIQKAVIIPVKEMWLHKNEAALSSVNRGIKEAKQKKFGRDPLTKHKNKSWLDEIED